MFEGLVEERGVAGERFVGDRAAARAVLRAARLAQHAPGWGQVLQDWYVSLFITATLLTMLFAATGGAILTPDCETAVCLEPSGYRALAVGLALGGGLALWAALRVAGPAGADPGTATWLLASPADRGVLLRGAVLRVGFVGMLSGASWGVLVGFALVGGAGTAGAAVPVVLAAAGGLLLAVVLLAAVLRRQGGSVRPVVAVRAVRDDELARAGQVVAAVTTSTLMLEGSAMGALAARRRMVRRGRHPSVRGRGGPLTGLLVHELRGLRRRAGRVLVAMSGPVAALAAGLLLGRFVGVILAALTVFVVVRASAGGLSGWLTSPALRRAVPAHPPVVTALLAAPPMVVSLIASALALLGLGLAWWSPFVLGLGATAGVLRSHDPPPGLGVAVATPAGAVQTGLVTRLVHGTDLALGSALLVLIGDALAAGPLAVAAGAALLAWQVLRTRE